MINKDESGIPSNPLMVRGFESLDLSSSYNGQFVRSYYPKTLIINDTVPKHYAYDFSSNKFEIDSVTHFIDRPDVAKVIVNGLTSVEFLEDLITNALGVRSGVIDTGVSLLTFDLLMDRVAKSLEKSGFAASDESVTVVSSMFVDLFQKLNLMLVSGKVRALETKRNLVPTKDEILSELRRMHIRVALENMTYEKITVQKKVSVAALVSTLQPMFIQLAKAISRVVDVDRSFEDVLTLIRLYNTNSFERLSKDEMGIFDDADFEELAANMTLGEMALMTTRMRPASGSAYWVRMIEKVGSLLKSSPVFKTVELHAFREWFAVTHIADQTDLRRGVIISKNLAERQPFQVFMKLQSDEDVDFVRLIEDKSCENAFSGIYDAASSLTSAKVHDFACAIATAAVTPMTPYFFFGIGVTDRELSYLSAAYGFPIEIVMSESGVVTYAFRIDQTGSRIRSESKSIVRISKTADPRVSMLYVKEGVVGKQTLSFGEKPIVDTKGYAFLGTGGIFTKNFSRSQNMDINIHGTNLNVKWDLSQLSGVRGLENTVSIYPIIGREIFTSLLNTYHALIDWSLKGTDVNKGFFETNATIGFTSVLKPILTTRDVEDMLSTATSQLWDVMAKTKDNHRLSSILGSDSLRAELKVRLTLYVLLRLGFLSSEKEEGVKDIKDTLRLFKESGAFNVISMEMAK